MQSIRRKDLVYTDTSTSILEHDEDFDAEEICIDGKTIYKGAIDPRYSEYGLDVQWLYNDMNERVGLIEYETLDRKVSNTLWYYDNPYGTFFQEPGWTTKGKTIWSVLSNEAYQDCLEDDFSSFIDMTLGSKTRIILPYMLRDIPTHYYECEHCSHRTLSVTNSCSSLKKVLFSGISSILFLDDSYVLYTPPDNSKLTQLLQHGADDQQEQEQEQAH